MIFRLSQELATKIKVAPKVCAPHDTNLFADWSAHLFVADRTQYIILVNTPSLYSLLMYGRGIASDNQFIEAALSCMLAFMPQDGNEFIFRRFIAPTSREVVFSKALNRGVTGSMNDLIACAKFHLVERKTSPFDASSALNEMPMSYVRYKNPREAFKAMKVDANAARLRYTL
jgi:hypothetical protein